jgi:hypothetical protein
MCNLITHYIVALHSRHIPVTRDKGIKFNKFRKGDIQIFFKITFTDDEFRRIRCRFIFSTIIEIIVVNFIKWYQME